MLATPGYAVDHRARPRPAVANVRLLDWVGAFSLPVWLVFLTAPVILFLHDYQDFERADALLSPSVTDALGLSPAPAGAAILPVVRRHGAFQVHGKGAALVAAWVFLTAISAVWSLDQ